MENLRQLNKERLQILAESDNVVSHGLQLLIDEIQQAQRFNAKQPMIRRSGEALWAKRVTVYFNYQTDNRLMAHIIVNNYGDSPRLERLVIPEAGHRLYANYKDGYQANGGNYSKPFAILERMVTEASKHIDVSKGVGHWQDFIKCEVIR
jgi:hypothetical protein